ncbi:MAG: AraC family transcriptional regulator [Bacillota bacterium]|nr:AraC family transcriptional regulator [Bacillota bacterium]
MELSTKGIRFYPKYIMPMKLLEEESFDGSRGYGERFRIMVIQDGSGILELNDKKFPLIAPAILCINEKERIILEKNSNLKVFTIYFHPGIINSIMNFENIRGYIEGEFSISASQDLYILDSFLNRDMYTGYAPIGPNTLRRVNYLYNRILEEIEEQRDNSWPCRSRSYLLETLYLIRRTFEIDLRTQKLAVDYSEAGDEIINDIIFYLFSNYPSKITINDMINIFHINRTSLMEKFSKATGSTIMNYLSKIRINVAAMILRDTTISVYEVMERVGFNDMSHFGRIFKRYLGCSPTEYRQKYCWMLVG